MNKSESPQSNDQDESNSKSKQKGRGKKRKRPSSESSSDGELVLPENTLEVEKNLHASAIKNNLDDVSVKKILKKVVTNDHVLALVKLREEEEDSSTEESLRPKLTRAKVKELMKVSPKSAPWNLELTPIKHIPVKTRPEVKALIAQELPEDEDDEEYEPTPDDVPSDDDHTLESSDIDSLPRTPATPKSQKKSTLKVVNDGPFKVPQPELSNAPRRKLFSEDATIALRTRSKLSLSSTSIEHIESAFVPPDDLPTPDVDSLWNNFLNDCLNPASNSRHEDDDDADPEYNVAADPDAQEEDEEALENSIIKISKKELNDLVTELFNIMPDTTTDLAENMAQEMITGGAQTEQTNRWEGKQEPVSDEENNTEANATAAHLLQALKIENIKIDNANRLSIGKNEPPDEEEGMGEMVIDEERINDDNANENEAMETSENTVDKPAIIQKSIPIVNKQSIVNRKESDGNQYPAVLQQMAVKEQEKVQIEIPKNEVMYPEQRTLLEQQLRQHVQLAAAAFMQLFVHPVQWQRATTYKEFLTSLNKMADDKPSSVVNVCNLKPAVELIAGWEASVSEPSPENIEMVKFLQNEVDKHRSRCDKHNLHVGDFPEMYMKVVANSTVFLYPYLLPARPFKPDLTVRRFSYLRSEDEYITLGLAQFWEYVLANPALFKPPVHNERQRWGLAATVRLVAKYMLPWMTPKTLMAHICTCRKKDGPENPIVKFFETNTVTPVKHKLLSFNPHITLYEQPEVELPRIWLRYLANTSKRFKTFYHKRKTILNGQAPDGVEIDTARINGVPKKVPLSIDFTKKISCNRLNAKKSTEQPTETLVNKIDVSINNGSSVPVLTPITILDNHDKGAKPFTPANIFTVVNTGNGSYLVPLQLPETTTVNTNTTPICAPTEETVEDTETDDVRTVETTDKTDPNPTDNKHTTQTKSDEHCTCCILLRKIWKQKQKTIFDYFKPKLKTNNCDCKGRRYPPLTNRLRLLVNHYKTNAQCVYLELNEKIRSLQREINSEKGNIEKNNDSISDDDEETDIAVALAFHLKLGFRSQLVRDYGVKRRIQTVFSRFKPDQDVNATLTSVLAKVFDVELVDLYKEFIGFLTPEQADSIGHFKDYFVQRCVQKLAARIEASVSDKEKRCNLLEYLSNNFSSNAFHKWPACEICTDILGHVQEWPELAKYVFSLFPHKRKESPSHQSQSTIEDTVPKKKTFVSNESPRTNDHSRPAQHPETLEDETTEGHGIEHLSPTHQPESAVFKQDTMLAGHEADHSRGDEENGGDEENAGDEANEGEDENNDDREPASQEMYVPEDHDIKTEEIVLGELNISLQKTVDSEPINTPTLALVIRPLTSLPNDDPLKTEEPEWKREEDKVILEILKQHITPEERRDKSIVDMIEESPVVQMIAESLPHKSADEVMERVFYLLQLLATSEQLKTSE